MKKLVLAFLFFCQVGVAQQFNYVAPLPEADSSAFYKIKLSPEIKSKLKPGLADLRLYDQDKKEVPYVLKSDQEINYVSSFIPYPFLKKEILKDSVTQIIIRKDSSRINNMSLMIRNAEVEKEMKLSGSFDTLQWFVVKEYHSIHSINNPLDVTAYLQIDFPATNYTYFKIDISDKHSAPVDVVKAGYFQTHSVAGNYSALNAEWYVSDSAHRKMSFLTLQWPQVNDVDAIELKVKSPAHFLRKATLYSMWYQGGTEYTPKYMGSLTLSSEASLRFAIEGVRTNKFLIEIHNGDDAPLKFDNVEAFQLNHYCIAQLEKNKKYEFRFTDAMTDFPSYDLRYFEKIIPADLKVIEPGHVLDVSVHKQSTVAKKNFFSDKRFIWAALSITVLLLGYVTYRMMKEMK